MKKINRFIFFISQVLFFALIANSISAQSPSNEKFQINKNITLNFVDGQSINLYDFVFYSNHEKPDVWWKDEVLSKEISIMLKLNDYWKIFDLSEIRSIILNWPAEYPKWIDVNIELNNGESYSGLFPNSPKLTWLNGDQFRFIGPEIISTNNKTDYRTTEIKLYKVKSIQRTADNNFELTTITDTKYTFTAQLKFITFGQNTGTIFRYSCIDHIGSSIHLIIDSEQKEIDINKISSIYFEEQGKSARIMLKDSSELKGLLKHQIHNLFGKIDSSKIWFGSVQPSVASIHFD